MIYTDIKQAIGSTLLDAQYYNSGVMNRFYWDVLIFDNGILIDQLENDDDTTHIMYIWEINTYMPEELKELITKYK